MKSLLYIFVAAISSSCFLLEPTAEYTQQEEKKEQYTALEKQLKDSIKKYINQNIIVGSESYSSYDFSEIYEHKPTEISEYEALIKRRNRLPYMESTYHGQLESEIAKTDSLIKDKKAFIKANRIHSTYEMGHIFKLSLEKSHRVAEYIFFHYPNGKVKNLTVSYSLQLSAKQLAAYNSYYYQKPIFYNNSEADYQFHKKVERQYDKEADKTMFLNQIVLIIESIKTNGSIIPEKIIPSVVKKSYPNQSISKITITKAMQEGFASDSNTTAEYQILAVFNDKTETINLDEWFRIISK